MGGNAQIKAMKKVAGRLRLDLAQYRELEAFAQFGTELDPSTQQQLERGERTVEILKQGQYEPMAVEEQVMVIFAATQGYLDELGVEQIHDWEVDFLEYVRSEEADLAQAIREEKDISDETDAALRKAIEFFTGVFQQRQEKAREALGGDLAPMATAGQAG